MRPCPGFGRTSPSGRATGPRRACAHRAALRIRFTSDELVSRKYWFTTPSARVNAVCGVVSPLWSSTRKRHGPLQVHRRRAFKCAPGVYHWCMARTNVDVDDEACAEVMRRYRLTTKREAVNFALRSLAAEPFSLEEARRMRGAGWDGDLDEMRGRSNEPR